MVRIGIVGIGFTGMNHKWFLPQVQKTAENTANTC
jgi:hypothetical protein